MYNHKKIKIISVILLLPVVVISLALYMVYVDIKTKNENHHAILHDLSLQGERVGYLALAQKSIDNISSEIDLVDSSIISKDGDIKFIENLEQIAREHGLSIEITSLFFENNPEFSPASMDILKIKAKTKGSWIGNYSFLIRLESLPFKIKINKYNLKSVQPITEAKVKTDNTWESVFEIDVLKYK